MPRAEPASGRLAQPGKRTHHRTRVLGAAPPRDPRENGSGTRGNAQDERASASPDDAETRAQPDENEAPREPETRREKPSRYETQKQQIRIAVRNASSRATGFESFAQILEADYGIEARMSRGRVSYGHPERQKNIIGRALGIDYEWPVIEANIRHRLERGAERARQSLFPLRYF